MITSMKGNNISKTAAQRATASNRAWKRGNTSKVNIQQQGIQKGDTDNTTEKDKKNGTATTAIY